MRSTVSESTPSRSAAPGTALSDDPGASDPDEPAPCPRGEFKVELADPDDALTRDERDRLVALFAAVAAQARTPAGVVSLALVDDAGMIAVHKQHLGMDHTTDVLCFDLRDPPTDVADDAPEAEIVLCVDEARRQAAARGHAVLHELLLYATHALLHLLGHDDHDPSRAAVMHAREDELLRAVGVGPVYGDHHAI